MDENLQENLAGPVRVMQIIVFALTMGLFFFLAIVCLAAPGGMGGVFGALPMLTSVGLGLAVTMIVVRWIVLQVATANARRGILRGASDANRGKSSTEQPDRTVGQLVAFYQTRMIIGAAMLEGVAFFLLVAYMVEHSPWSLVAAIVMILGVAAHFPTQGRVAEWVERQTYLLQQE